MTEPSERTNILQDALPHIFLKRFSLVLDLPAWILLIAALPYHPVLTLQFCQITGQFLNTRHSLDNLEKYPYFTSGALGEGVALDWFQSYLADRIFCCYR